MQKTVFTGGLPGNYRRKLFNRDELRAGPLQAIVKACKRWEKTERLVQLGDASNMQLQKMAFHNAAAVSYHAKKAESEDNSDDMDTDEDVPAFVGLAEKTLGTGKKSTRFEAARKNEKNVDAAVNAQIAKEKQAKEKVKEQQQYSALVAKIEQLEAISKPEVMEEILQKKVESMMTKDTKPTAKAGTKGDPMTEHSEEQYQNRQRNFQNRRDGNFQQGGRGFNRGRGGYDNRNGGRNNGGNGNSSNFRSGSYHNGGNGNGSNFRGNFKRGGNGPKDRNQERTDNGQVDNKSKDQKTPSKEMKDLKIIASAMEKSAAALNQHTAALAQISQSKN
jgi:hypothetical protein